MPSNYYTQVLEACAFELRQCEHGDGLFAKVNLPAGTELVEDVPVAAYMLPARHFLHYALRGNVEPVCFNCFKKIAGEPVYCLRRKEHCYHIYCSEACRQRHWMNHCLLCLDANVQQYATIKSLYSERETYSDYAVAEILTGLLYKASTLVLSGVGIEDAVQRVFQPLHELHGYADQELYKINLTQRYKRVRQFFECSLDKLDIALNEQARTYVLDAFINLPVFNYIYSLIAMNGVSIAGLGVGIYIVVSKLNHSCCPNCDIKFRDSSAILVTERPLEAGEQLFISYVDDKLSRSQRRQLLRDGWGFECNCDRCSSEG